VPKSCWIGEDNAGKASTDRRFTVTVENVATGGTASVTVHGEDEVDATIDADDLPTGPSGQIDGVTFEYVVVRKEKWCSAGSPSLGICQVTATRTSFPSPAQRSTQDARAPTASLTLAAGRAFTRSLEVAARVDATDPGSASSGAGYVAFGGTERRGGCAPLAPCVEPLGPGLTVRLAPGPDGQRIVEARVYDKARGPTDDPGATTIGTPPGNASTPFSDAIYVDRTAPAIFIRISTTRVMVGSPVTFDASQSTDPGEGSGLRPASAAWSFGEGAPGAGLVVTRTYSRTGRFPFTFTVTDNAGNVALTDPVEIDVTAAPVPPQPGTAEKPPQAPRPETVDRRAPTLSSLSVRRRAGRATVAFRLSERGVVRVEVRRVLPRPVRRTAALSRGLRAGRRGVLLPAAATRKRGRYVIVLVARDRAGNVSKPRTLRLTTR
jgi:hypothetical protein